MLFHSGVSADADPHYHKLCSRVSHIWGNRKGQPNRSAMERPRPGGTSLLIKVSPEPGKYADFSQNFCPIGKVQFKPIVVQLIS